MLNKQVLMKLVILIGYAGLIFYLLLTGRVSMYLHPKMNVYILASGLILLVLALVAAKDLFKKTHAHKGYSAYGIFLVALMLAIFVQPIALNSVLAENRGVTIGKNKIEKTTQEDASTKVQIDETKAIEAIKDMNDKEAIKDSEDTEIVINDDNYAAILGDIYYNFEGYKNRTIVISGFVFRDEKIKEQNFVIARSAINCCTADASPIGLLCEFAGASDLKNDEWIRVKGVLRESIIEGEKTPQLVITNFEKIEKPQEEYIYLD